MKKNVEIAFNLFLIAFGLWGFQMAVKYKYMAADKSIGPGFMPRWGCGLLIAANLINILCIFVKKGYAHEGPMVKSAQNLKNLALFFGLVILYVLGVMKVGMYVSTLVFMVLVYRLVDKMEWKQLVIPTAGTILVLFLLFQKLLGLKLPGGLLF